MDINRHAPNSPFHIQKVTSSGGPLKILMSKVKHLLVQHVTNQCDKCHESPSVAYMHTPTQKRLNHRPNQMKHNISLLTHAGALPHASQCQ